MELLRQNHCSVSNINFPSSGKFLINTEKSYDQKQNNMGVETVINSNNKICNDIINSNDSPPQINITLLTLHCIS